ncbi:inositol-phosphate phosphatase [Desulfonema ishimotonii]|uniref:Inositol-1-monophosphatase n=1 Tax=Desulfonema ishimotonii TaxID=45657 RepID=A0A401FPX5_9BACT|nr:inositol monophosphatase family protein [Desulfonema ishimotonii]GBC59073.1 inositol-phosphate phosphatase [Desulfonema ishimotonii]
MDLEYIKRIGTAAAYNGGRVLHSCLGNISDIRKKGDIDLVTEADTGSEKEILATLLTRFPDHAILAEESGLSPGDADCQWIIDPLDGTTNFAHGLPQFSVSIAFAHRGRVVVGVVLNPVSGELFTAVSGKGAHLNGRPIRVSQTETVSEGLLVTGFPYNFKEIFSEVIGRFARCLKASRGVRRLGSAALDLCFVACGRFDGFWEQNLKPWDTAAGMLIAKEAGARVTDFSDMPFTADGPEILASNGKLHEEMLSLLKSEDTTV